MRRLLSSQSLLLLTLPEAFVFSQLITFQITVNYMLWSIIKHQIKTVTMLDRKQLVVISNQARLASELKAKS